MTISSNLTHEDWQIRKEAVKSLADKALLVEIALTDSETQVRETAVKMILEEDINSTITIGGRAIPIKVILGWIATDDTDDYIKIIAIEGIKDNKLLNKLNMEQFRNFSNQVKSVVSRILVFGENYTETESKVSREIAESNVPDNNDVETEQLSASDYIDKGNFLYEQGKLDEAKREYKKGLEINPDNPTVHYNLGVIYQSTDQFDSAIIEYEESLKQSPFLTVALNNLGLCFSKLGKYEKAIDCYKRFLSLTSIESGPGHSAHVSRVEELIRELEAKI